MGIFVVCLVFQNFVNKGSLTECINQTVSDIKLHKTQKFRTLYVLDKFHYVVIHYVVIHYVAIHSFRRS